MNIFVIIFPACLSIFFLFCAIDNLVDYKLEKYVKKADIRVTTLKVNGHWSYDDGKPVENLIILTMEADNAKR